MNAGGLIWQWEADINPIVSAVTAVALFVLGVKIIKLILTDDHVPIHDSTKTHNWRSVSLMKGPCYCNICQKLMISGEGLVCDCCGVCCDPACIAAGNSKLPCKVITLPKDELMKHHWVKGNLPAVSVCEVCEDECSSSNGLKGYRCCWCLQTVHSHCKLNMAEVCDFGAYRPMIIPPTSVEVVRKRNSMRRRLVLKSVHPTGWTDWSPLIVIANCKSGGKDGDDVMSLFRGILNPAQVVDLGSKQPEAALEWCVMLNDITCRILVAGGDGTVGWVLNTINKLKLPHLPPVAIIPLGTGNDLSRVLGWGKEASGNLDPVTILDEIATAETVPFDRWLVKIKPFRSLRIKANWRELFMYNYLSIGVDAQVTYDFHKARESPFYIFSSRMLNKLLYLGYGTQQIIEKKCQGLNHQMELFLDGVRVELPAIESVVVLNIDSWGAGVRLWEMGEDQHDEDDDDDDDDYSKEGCPEFVPQSYSDGKLEVLAIYSSLHIAQLQVGLSLPYRVGQASSVQVKLHSPTAVQVDGEPWLQHPAEFSITHFNQALVLKGNIQS